MLPDMAKMLYTYMLEDKKVKEQLPQCVIFEAYAQRVRCIVYLPFIKQNSYFTGP